VWFGGTKSQLLSSSQTKLVVELPVVNRAGTVDVTLRLGDRVVLTAPGAFTFYDPSGPVPPPAPSTTALAPVSTTSSTTTVPGQQPPADSPGDPTAPSDPTDPRSPGGGSPGGPTTTAAPRNPSIWYAPGPTLGFGEPVSLPNGLTGALLTDGVEELPLSGWSAQRCSTDTCTAAPI
jgi:hypothetical protein